MLQYEVSYAHQSLPACHVRGAFLLGLDLRQSLRRILPSATRYLGTTFRSGLMKEKYMLQSALVMLSALSIGPFLNIEHGT